VEVVSVLDLDLDLELELELELELDKGQQLVVLVHIQLVIGFQNIHYSWDNTDINISMKALFFDRSP